MTAQFTLGEEIVRFEVPVPLPYRTTLTRRAASCAKQTLEIRLILDCYDENEAYYRIEQIVPQK